MITLRRVRGAYAAIIVGLMAAVIQTSGLGFGPRLVGLIGLFFALCGGVMAMTMEAAHRDHQYP